VPHSLPNKEGGAQRSERVDGVASVYVTKQNGEYEHLGWQRRIEHMKSAVLDIAPAAEFQQLLGEELQALTASLLHGAPAATQLQAQAPLAPLHGGSINNQRPVQHTTDSGSGRKRKHAGDQNENLRAALQSGATEVIDLVDSP